MVNVDDQRGIVGRRTRVAMGSEVDAEAASVNAADSDGSVSWEDFFGK